jgi:hypothetical protein
MHKNSNKNCSGSMIKIAIIDSEGDTEITPLKIVNSDDKVVCSHDSSGYRQII